MQMSNLQTLHILTSQSFSCVAQRSSALYCKGHNDTQNFVMFTIASDGVWKLGLGLETHFCKSRSLSFQVSRLSILQRTHGHYEFFAILKVSRPERNHSHYILQRNHSHYMLCRDHEEMVY